METHNITDVSKELMRIACPVDSVMGVLNVGESDLERLQLEVKEMKEKINATQKA